MRYWLKHASASGGKIMMTAGSSPADGGSVYVNSGASSILPAARYLFKVAIQYHLVLFRSALVRVRLVAVRCGLEAVHHQQDLEEACT